MNESLRALDDNQAIIEEQLAAEPLNPRLRRRAAIVQQFRSGLYFDDQYANFRDAAKALDPARRYLTAAQWMVDHDPNDVAARYSHAVATFRLALVLTQLDPPQAVATARDALGQLDALLKAGKENRLMTTGRITALRRLALAEWKAGHLEAARKVVQEALTAEEPQAQTSVDERQKLSIILALAARIAAASGDFVRAQEWLLRASQNATTQARSGEFNYRVTLGAVEEAAVDIASEAHRPDDANAAYLRLRELWTSDPDRSEYTKAERSKFEKPPPIR